MPVRTDGVPEWLQALRLVDHHCHGVVASDLDARAFEDLITESDRPSPEGTTFFDTQLGLAIRQYCAPALELTPFPRVVDYLNRRTELGAREVNSRLLTATGISDYVVETGHQPRDILTPAEMGAAADSGYAEVVRLERIAEVTAEQVAPEDFVSAFRSRLEEHLRTAIGVKSIAAYRGGFAIDPTRPSDDEVLTAVEAWIAGAGNDARLRLDDPVIIRFGWWEAIDRSVPIQLHVGYGDPDVDLHRCDPLLLTDLLRLARGSGSSFMLLHCYPFHREAGYLAHVFEHVYCDIGLALTYTGAQSAQIVAESLELAPFHKVLFSSDAFGAAELFHIGAALFRRGLAQALRTWGDGQWPQAEQERVARLVAAENARRVYRLDSVPTTTFGGDL